MVELRDQVRRIDPRAVDERLYGPRQRTAALGPVARRTHEIGIRMALGAAERSVIRLVMREMLVVIPLGIAGGAAAAVLCGQFVESQLFRIKGRRLYPGVAGLRGSIRSRH